MSRRAALCLVAVIVFANAAATVPYSGEGSVDPLTKRGHRARSPILQGLTEILTLPIPTRGITDVRDVALITSLGLALLVVAIARASLPELPASHNTGERATDQSTADSIAGLPQNPRGIAVSAVKMQARRLCHRSTGAGSQPVAPFPSTTEAWLFCSAAGVTVLAVLSAIANDTFDLSWGWIVRLVACAGWAMLIARTFTAIMVRRTLFALLALALVCLTLTIIDRADRGLAHFSWPIGPITITAALAAVWAATAGAWAVGEVLFRRLRPASVLSVITCIVGVYVLQQTGRRAPGLGLIAAALTAGSVLLWSRYRSRLLNVGIVGLLLASLIGAVIYLTAQLRSPVRETSGPLALRLAYWRLSGGLIADHPWLGCGPDNFVVEMTNLIAPMRAESPHFFHGNFDPYAHNEWIQAAVEMGVPGALAYLALPLGVMFFAVRRLRNGATHRAAHDDHDHSSGNENRAATRAMVVALIAGLTTILITECASIALRVPMMPAWYWTLLGLLAALCRAAPQQRRHRRDACATEVLELVTHSRLIPPRAVSAGFLILAVACFAVSATELKRSVAEAREQRGPDGRFAARLYANKTIDARHKAAVLASREAYADRKTRKIETALSLWRDLYDTMPSLHDVPAMYADILNLSGQPDAARAVLEDALSDRLNPYNVAANTSHAHLLTDDPIGQLRCVQRALRSGGLDTVLQAILVDVFEHPAAVDSLNRNLPHARTIASGGSGNDVSTPTVELLRISAFVKERAHRMDEAIADQRLAARFYRRLEQGRSPYRRTDKAETDAFLVLAHLLYKADHANYREAYEAIIEAERYAILGIRHEEVADPQPERGFLGGVVVPTELPSRLYSLWRLSALLHVMVGNDYYLDGRIYSGLPPSQWTEAELNRQLARLARQAYQDLSEIPPAKRPDHYPALRDMARRYERMSREQIRPPAPNTP